LACTPVQTTVPDTATAASPARIPIFYGRLLAVNHRCMSHSKLVITNLSHFWYGLLQQRPQRNM